MTPAEVQKCGEVAVVQVYWPGKPPLPSCPVHMTAALGVANVLGFYLHFDNCDPTPCRHAAGKACGDDIAPALSAEEGET